MVLIKEFRIPLPFTLEEYQRGQLYMIAKASKEETNGTDGIEVKESKDFENEMGKGIYTHRVIHLTSRLPSWIKRLFPFIGNVLQIEEKSWNMFPYSKTEYKCNLFGDRCKVMVESIHSNDNGSTHNIHNLSDDILNQREVKILDITEDPDDSSTDGLEQASTFVSKKVKRGPLKEGWMNGQPVICAYKIVYAEFNVKGLRKRIEQFIIDIFEKVYLRTHRQAFVWMDEWIDLSIDDIREIEEKAHEHMNNKMKNKNEDVNRNMDDDNKHKLDDDNNDDLSNLRHPSSSSWGSQTKRRIFGLRRIRSKL